MNNQEAYNTWAENYDTVLNKTRDLEALAIRTVLSKVSFTEVIEIGCGTGKNTEWIAAKANHLTAVDFSIEMLNKAKEKIKLKNVEFIHADITKEWAFTNSKADLITCSLILEHIKDIDFIFKEAKNALKSNGLFYIGELHPFKQYNGSKARFDMPDEIFELECHIHNISEYFESAMQNNFSCVELSEWFDNDDQTSLPRLVSFLFQKLK
jgi:ubiquinone/menaquinone biosynthesis C-methylase UbiE